MVRSIGTSRGYKWVGWLLFIFLLTASPLKVEEAQPPEDSASPDSTLSRAASLYDQHCSKCHGMKGEGGKGSPLDSTGHAWHHPDGQLYDFIHNGKWGPVENMPPFKDTLNAKEIDEIIVFIKTFWDEEQREMQADMSSRYRAPKQGK